MSPPEDRSTIWPIFVFGAVCLAVAIALAAMVMLAGAEGIDSPFDAVAVGLPFAAALAAFRAGRDARLRRRAMAEGEPVAPRARRRAVAEPPPRLGDDPFRDPPGTPPIVVERPAVARAAAPIVPGGPGDRPKVLT